MSKDLEEVTRMVNLYIDGAFLIIVGRLPAKLSLTQAENTLNIVQEKFR
ncbi:unannotated protein [freshwater metagenome]|uniref:Unannotated protein n=2 Tax=freshwater metagenome TaxID=449393 RepID=A0A6J6BY33_9ZZZZ|nr:hypothetical protein [Actinomycetota bacterium]